MALPTKLSASWSSCPKSPFRIGDRFFDLRFNAATATFGMQRNARLRSAPPPPCRRLRLGSDNGRLRFGRDSSNLRRSSAFAGLRPRSSRRTWHASRRLPDPLRQGFRVADDRRQWGAQLVAGIGHKIGPHPLRGPARSIGRTAGPDVPPGRGRTDRCQGRSADPIPMSSRSACRPARIVSSARGWRIAKRRSRPWIAPPSSDCAA